MRLSPLMLALSASLLAACQQPAVRGEASAGADESAATRQEAEADASHINAIDVASVEQKNLLTAESLAKISAPPPSAPKPAMAWRAQQNAPAAAYAVVSGAMPDQGVNTERYADHMDNPVQLASESPVSTFSIDVDTGSYSNIRRMLLAGQRPPTDAVRAEEMINYFDYGYSVPRDRSQPFSVTTELANAPWNGKHQLLQIGIQGYRVPAAAIPASNLVFLIDTSGSMQDPDKLPLLKRSFAELARNLRPQDRVSIVVYAGSAGLVLAPTPGDRKDLILAALDRLEAGGSTNGGEGLKLAYDVARSAFLPKGVNRVLLATDGDFNVGTIDQTALETMVSDQRKSGIALTTLGFGTGNYNDQMAERLADLGDGNHAYIDSLNEGRKVLVEELSSTMLTIAQDVKIQVEFNPAVVAEYRLIGYENRALRREDFNNDKVDAGEIGAGHDVTALYEITLVGSGGNSVDPLRYGKRTTMANHEGELAWLRLRYKHPGESASKLIESAITPAQRGREPSPALRWSAAVAAYADLLRGGEHMNGFGWDQVRELANSARGEDRWGYRAEFIELVDRAKSITRGTAPVAVSQ